MLKANLAGAAIAALLTVLALAIPSAQGQSGNPCTPRATGANSCSLLLVTRDGSGNPVIVSRVTARWNGTCAGGEPVMVAVNPPNEPRWGNISVAGTVPANGDRILFAPPVNAAGDAFNGDVLLYRVEMRGDNASRATVQYRITTADGPGSKVIETGDTALDFVHRNVVLGDDVPVPVTRTGFVAQGEVQGDFRRADRPPISC